MIYNFNVYNFLTLFSTKVEKRVFFFEKPIAIIKIMLYNVYVKIIVKGDMT